MAWPSDTSASRLGASNEGTDKLALFLKKFAGEVLTTFNLEAVMPSMIRSRTIMEGKSAQFPVTGQVQAAYHVPGDNVLDSSNGVLDTVFHAERVINIDQLLTSAVFVDAWDEMVNHYEIRSIYSTELGRALARKTDNQLLRMAILAARATKTVTDAASDTFDGETILDADFETNGSSAVETIFSVAQKFDEKNIPSEDRAIVVTPQAYYNIIKAAGSLGALELDSGATVSPSPVLTTSIPGVLDKDLGGEGSFSNATLSKVAGIRVLKSNNLPNGTDDSGTPETGDNNTYTGNFTNTLAVAFHKEAVGSVKLRDMAVESERLIEYQGTLMLAKMAVGHNILRPEASIEIDSA